MPREPVKTTREATDKSFKDEDRFKDIKILMKKITGINNISTMTKISSKTN